MTINLITQKQYDLLIEAQKAYPNLTYQNTGYDYPNKDKWNSDEKAAFKIVEEILKKAIVGFSKFNHFKVFSNGNLGIRFQFDWDIDADYQNKTHFIGVGYLKLTELLNGFKNNDKDTNNIPT